MRTARVRADLYSAMSAQPPLPSKGQPLQGIFYLHPRSPLIGGKAVFNYAVCYSAKGGQNSKRYPLRDGYVRLAVPVRLVLPPTGIGISGESSEPKVSAAFPPPIPLLPPTAPASRGGRTHTLEVCWLPTSIRGLVQAAESPLYPARTSSRPPPAAPYRLGSYVICVSLPPRLTPKRQPAPNNIGQPH